MGEGEHLRTAAGVSRRELIKKSVVAGGLVWAAPAVLAGPAAAEHSCEHCEFLFGLKFERPGPCGGVASCETPGTTVSEGNCLASAGHTTFESGCCLTTTTAVSCNSGTETHPYVELICYPSEASGCTPTSPCTTTNTAVIDLAPGVALCDARSKCGSACVPAFTTSTVTKCEQQFTRVTMDCTHPDEAGGLSHIEILVCVLGTVPPCG